MSVPGEEHDHRPPVRIVRRNPKVNHCPRKIAQHLGGCYCMTYVCCGELMPGPHAVDCGGVIEVMEPDDGE